MGTTSFPAPSMLWKEPVSRGVCIGWVCPTMWCFNTYNPTKGDQRNEHHQTCIASPAQWGARSRWMVSQALWCPSMVSEACLKSSPGHSSLTHSIICTFHCGCFFVLSTVIKGLFSIPHRKTFFIVFFLSKELEKFNTYHLLLISLLLLLYLVWISSEFSWTSFLIFLVWEIGTYIE